MRIIEEFIKAKKNDPLLCEDGYVISDNFIAVIDGVTSKGNYLWCDSKTSGRYAMEIIKKSLSDELSEMNSTELFNYLSKQLSDEYYKEFNEIVTAERLRACMIVYSKKYGEIWSYGDCQCLINGKGYQDEKTIDSLTSKKRAEVLKEALSNGATVEELLVNDIGRKAIQKDLVNQFQYENKKNELGYPVLNGDEIVPEYIKIYKVPENATIVLSSDGYPKLCKTLEESEAELERIIKTDPLCIYENVQTKGLLKGNSSFDDRCYVRFEV